MSHHLNGEEAPYRCNLCPLASDCDKGAIVKHMKTRHNGDRPFECRDCHLAFTTKDNCELHLRKGHGKTSRDEIRASIIFQQQQQQQRDEYDDDDESSVNEQGDDDGLLDLSADAPAATVNIP